MRVVGVDNKSSLFLIKDTQINSESMMEDISHILNNGEVPELFSNEEKAKYVEEMEIYKQDNQSEKAKLEQQKNNAQ